MLEIFYAVLLLVLATIVANTIYPYFPAIPQAFYQIAAGAILSLAPLYHHFVLEPEIFMLVIIAPLMFYDGQNANPRDIRKNFGSILSMAVALAILTVVLMGYVSQTVLAGLPLALAFALAAIVTPTDAVAVSSITTNIAVPERVMGMLERESLFNDASGLVAFSLALTAFTTGEFSLSSGIKHFLIVFFGGLLIGLVLGAIAVWARVYLVQSGKDSASVIVPYDVLVPFLIYLAAEHAGLSGILAVVAAGLVYSVSTNQLRLSSTQLQLVSRSTWTILTNILNGFVFVLLGVSLPTVWVNIQQDHTKSLTTFITLAVLLYLVMLALRYLWIRLNWALIHSDKSDRRQHALIGALSGVHGTITLAMAFSLPLTYHGASFPFRNTMIFIAAVVIILSLLVPTIVLPFILPSKQLPVDPDDVVRERKALVDYATSRLAQENPDSAAATQTVIEILNSQATNERPDRHKVQGLLNHATKIETQTVQQMADDGVITQAFAARYIRILVFKSQLSSHNPFVNLTLWFRFVSHRVRHGFSRRFRRQARIRKQQEWLATHDASPEQRAAQQRRLALEQRRLPRKRQHNRAVDQERRADYLKIESTVYENVMTFLTETASVENQAEVNAVRNYYNARHRRFNASDATSEAQNEMFIQAFQYEYTYIREQRSAQRVSAAMAEELYQQVSTDQMLYMQEFADAD
ncbi:NhaP-type Na+ H+ and K+ H+ antiporter [Levilactobacillus senmaizukei DSM 21775 = NBRC 103853]|uniref:NhaP-type Na+ H+ and K+ H+ antiporter n=1 Tax=Levilactobacillus senmaizukei DSM 21775 = NBRC 103853 TaxID=1423803 RepID=A0A0R2DD67_9LACO|nr:sodium:proton antiporter [Levilactobacillus senmaizukei]KRN01414.1 NhaP-type Na+ H+ and K+ H+ antiporter [Levilactobacillus senmaizukei DSM 21775 = NBRC 103853]